MKTISISVKKIDVYNEVAKTTSYTGAKMQNDDAAYERIFTTDADRELLERFWIESCDDSTSMIKPFLKSVSTQDLSGDVKLEKDYTAELEMSNSFDDALAPAINSLLFSYFVNAISSKWFEITNKEDVGKYTASALNSMEGVREKLYFRKRPQRKKI